MSDKIEKMTTDQILDEWEKYVAARGTLYLTPEDAERAYAEGPKFTAIRKRADSEGMTRAHREWEEGFNGREG